MGADEFRDYILGFIFYKYLSEKLRHFADRILSQDGIKYKEIDEGSTQGKEYLEAIQEETLENHKPSLGIPFLKIMPKNFLKLCSFESTSISDLWLNQVILDLVLRFF